MRTDTLRQQLLKIGARIVASARKVWVHRSTGSPDQAMFARLYNGLQRWVR